MLRFTVGSTVLVASLLVGPVNAAPMTVFFSGTVLSLSDLAAGVDAPLAVGTSFSGHVTYDVRNPEYYEARVNEYGQPIAYATSDSGCSQVVNSSCTDDRGSDPPLVLDYRLVWSGTSYAPISGSLGLSDNSIRYNQSVGGEPSGEVWSVTRNQFQNDLTGDPFGSFESTLTRRLLSLGVWSQGNIADLLSGPASDLEQGFDFDAVPPGQLNVNFFEESSKTECVYGQTCPDVYAPGSFQLRGTLTSATFRLGRVPEPASLALVCAAMLGLLIVRRRQL